MSPPLPGTARGDVAVYDGRECIGFVRGSVGNVFEYDSEGRPVGTCADQKAAQAILRDRAGRKAASS